MADEPVLATIPPNGLREWAEQRVAAGTAPTVWGLNHLIRSAAQDGTLYVRLSRRGSVWAWRPENVHRPAAAARAGRVKAMWLPSGEGLVAAPLKTLWLAAYGYNARQDDDRPATIIMSDVVLVARTELPEEFHGR